MSPLPLPGSEAQCSTDFVVLVQLERRQRQDIRQQKSTGPMENNGYASAVFSKTLFSVAPEGLINSV